MEYICRFYKYIGKKKSVFLLLKYHLNRTTFMISFIIVISSTHTALKFKASQCS